MRVRHLLVLLVVLPDRLHVAELVRPPSLDPCEAPPLQRLEHVLDGAPRARIRGGRVRRGRVGARLVVGGARPARPEARRSTVGRRARSSSPRTGRTWRRRRRSRSRRRRAAAAGGAPRRRRCRARRRRRTPWRRWARCATAACAPRATHDSAIVLPAPRRTRARHFRGNTPSDGGAVNNKTSATSGGRKVAELRKVGVENPSVVALRLIRPTMSHFCAINAADLCARRSRRHHVKAISSGAVSAWRKFSSAHPTILRSPRPRSPRLVVTPDVDDVATIAPKLDFLADELGLERAALGAAVLRAPVILGTSLGTRDRAAA